MSGVMMAGLYALWLTAGALDFHFHRRTCIAQTSGLRESVLHGLQLGIIGGAALLWLTLAPTRGLAAALALAAGLHALAGYMDTVSADGRRRISPAEQHVHSVLDVAPWLSVAWVAAGSQDAWGLTWQPAPLVIWLGVLAPAIVLAGLPWLAELRRCLQAAPN